MAMAMATYNQLYFFRCGDLESMLLVERLIN
jgi:hypothetical protein